MVASSVAIKWPNTSPLSSTPLSSSCTGFHSSCSVLHCIPSCVAVMKLHPKKRNRSSLRRTRDTSSASSVSSSGSSVSFDPSTNFDNTCTSKSAVIDNMYSKYVKTSLVPLAWLIVGTVMLFNNYDGSDSAYVRRSLSVREGSPNGDGDDSRQMTSKAATIPSAREWFHDVDCPLKDMSLLLPMHHKDFPLASTLFNSLEKTFPCFNELVVIVPPESEFAIAGGVPSYAKVVIVPDPLPPQFGYLSQQVVKLYADQYTTAPRVLILEADLIMKQYAESCFFSVDKAGNYNGKVRAYCTPTGNDIWFKGTHHAVGGDEPIGMDCCVNSPFAYPREVFPAFREHIEQTHGKPLGTFMEDYFEGHSKAWTPQDKLFSEFNILSHYMIRYHPEWVEVVTPEDGREKFEVERHACSDHQYERDYRLPNPKLTAGYFDNYYNILDKTLGNKGEEREHMTLDIGKKWDAGYNFVPEAEGQSK